MAKDEFYQKAVNLKTESVFISVKKPQTQIDTENCFSEEFLDQIAFPTFSATMAATFHLILSFHVLAYNLCFELRTREVVVGLLKHGRITWKSSTFM